MNTETIRTICSILSEKPVSDSSFPVSQHIRIAVCITSGIGYTIQAFFQERFAFSVTDFEYANAVRKFCRIIAVQNI